MVSKKMLAVVAVCIAVLLGAVGVYAYIQINSNKTKTRTFNFKWEPSEQNLTGFGVYPELPRKVPPTETLYMKATFRLFENKTLYIIVRVNDNDPSDRDYLGLGMEYPVLEPVFDAGYAVLLYGYGWYNYGKIKESGFIWWADTTIVGGGFAHEYNCVYDKNKGYYTFYVTLPPPEEPPADWVHLCYCSNYDIWVSVRFHLDLLNEWEA